MVKTWTDLLRRLTAKGKIEEALVLNSAGDIITCSPGLRLSETDINGIRCIFGSHYYSLMKLNFCGRSYTCFRNCESHNCMIGRCEDRILVMQHYNDMVILGMSTSGTPGSCLYELTHFTEKISRVKHVDAVAV